MIPPSAVRWLAKAFPTWATSRTSRHRYDGLLTLAIVSWLIVVQLSLRHQVSFSTVSQGGSLLSLVAAIQLPWVYISAAAMTGTAALALGFATHLHPTAATILRSRSQTRQPIVPLDDDENLGWKNTVVTLASWAVGTVALLVGFFTTPSIVVGIIGLSSYSISVFLATAAPWSVVRFQFLKTPAAFAIYATIVCTIGHWRTVSPFTVLFLLASMTSACQGVRSTLCLAVSPRSSRSMTMKHLFGASLILSVAAMVTASASASSVHESVTSILSVIALTAILAESTGVLAVMLWVIAHDSHTAWPRCLTRSTLIALAGVLSLWLFQSFLFTIETQKSLAAFVAAAFAAGIAFKASLSTEHEVALEEAFFLALPFVNLGNADDERDNVAAKAKRPVHSPTTGQGGGRSHGHILEPKAAADRYAFWIGSGLLVATAIYFSCTTVPQTGIRGIRVPPGEPVPPVPIEPPGPPKVFPTKPLRVLVTGGAGFVGSHYVRSVLASDASSHVTVVDNLSNTGIHTIAPLLRKYNRSRFQFVYGDILTSSVLKRAIEVCQPNVIVHLASPKPSSDCDDSCKRILVDGPRVILDALGDELNQTRLVFASSADVYGLPTNMNGSTNAMRPFAEDSIVTPPTPFTRSLVIAEETILNITAQHNSTSYILRLFPITGPTAVPEPANPGPLRWTGASAGLPGPETHHHDWVHINDVVKALLLASEAGLPVSETQIVNIGSGASCFGGAGSSANPGLLADIRKAKKALGYEPKFAHLRSSPSSSDDPTTHPEYNDLLESLDSAPWLLPMGLLRPIHEPLANDLARIAAHVSARATTKQEGKHANPADDATRTNSSTPSNNLGNVLETKKITVIPYQKAYRPLAENLAYSLTVNGKTRNYMFFAIDSESARECLYYNIPCYNATTMAEADYTNSDSNMNWRYREHKWSVISWVKPRLVAQLLDLGYVVNLSDTDISFIRDVWSSYEEYMYAVDADQVITAEIVPGVFIANTGNYIVRPTPTTKRFWHEYLAVGAHDPTTSDQHAWGQVYVRLGMQFCQTQEECANQRAKGFTAVRDHSAFFGRRNFCPHPIDICKPDLIYIHPICMAGRDTKIGSIRNLGGWFMSDEKEIGYYCAQKDKYGFAECPRVPKGLLDGFAVGEEPRLPCAGTKAVLTSAENN